MHIVFGVSSLALLGATIWMLVADHNKSWREPQLQFRTAEARYLTMTAMQEETAAFDARTRELENAERLAKAANAPAGAVEGFIAQARELDEKYQTRIGESRIEDVQEAQTKLSENTTTDLSEADPAIEAREELVAAMRAVIKQVQFVENVTANDKKTAGSLRDQARSNYDLAIRDSLPDKVAEERFEEFQKIEKQVGEFDLRIQEIKARRNALEAYVAQVTKPVENATAALNDHKKEFERLHASAEERSGNFWKYLLDMPILNAFGGPSRPHQIWLPELKIKHPLNQVARFDRCMTCHQGMDRTKPGSATDPAFPHEDRVFVNLIPQKPAPIKSEKEGEPDTEPEPTLENVYGIKLAEKGLIDETAVTVVVFPQSNAAKAGMKTADILQSIGGARVIDKAMAFRLLIDAAEYGKPIAVEVRRGLPHPFSAHPRLDLIGSDSSPHPFGRFGCTICHEGQGTATAFQHAEHTPNTVAAEDEWRRDFRWYSNHYWDWPQKPVRFLEASCLKCHHDVVSLKASDRFPQAPAPKVTHGYDLIREFGCFGCHEVKGYTGPDKMIGPDIRLEPDYFAWAILLKQEIEPRLKEQAPALKEALEVELKLATERDEVTAQKTTATAAMRQDEVTQLTARENELKTALATATEKRIAIESPINELRRLLKLAEQVRTMPEDAAARAQLVSVLSDDAVREKDRAALEATRANVTAALGAAATDAAKAADEAKAKEIEAQLAAVAPPMLDAAAHRMADKFKDVETPGEMRKVGPSLRYVGAKVDGAFLYDWISNPQHFRPTTKMPRVFGQYDHLGEEGLKTAKRFEQVEIQGIVAYLLDKSQAFTYMTPPASSEEGDAQIKRGREAFVTRGCLACHMLHESGEPEEGDLVAAALAAGHEHQGPDLARMGAKLAAGARKDGRDPAKWLYTWLKQPNLYHARTKMPNLQLDPVAAVDAMGQPVLEDQGGDQVAKTTDPAADIAAYLLSLGGWEPTPAPAVNQSDLDDLALMHLAKAYRESEAREILKTGLKRDPSELKGDDVELAIGRDKPGQAAATPSAEELAQRKLLYVGRRAISKYGCFGCHDMPGFEDAKPIGTGLADWGRKEVDKLAFEQIAHYHGGGHGHGDHKDDGHGHDAHGASNENGNGVMTEDAKRKADNHEYFHHQLLHGTRDGFLWQKIREPRSYDFKKTETKTYNDWLRMPKFTFPKGEDDAEAVMTFVLGLVSDPPAPQYLYNPGPRQKAIVEGLQVLDKFNCAGCHVLRPDQVAVNFEPSRPGEAGKFPAPESFRGYEFLRKDPTPLAVDQSLAAGYDGRTLAMLHGLPSLSVPDLKPFLITDDGQPYEPAPDEPPPEELFRPFLLWKDTLVDGKMHYVGQKPTNLPAWLIDESKSAHAWGGTAARLMMPLVYSLTKPVRGDLTGDGTWALVPPPLVGQGSKTQTAWLYDFLLDPHPIRPAAVLRMPKFNMSKDEARKLVAYFAAVDDVQHPYSFDERTRNTHLISAEAEREDRLGDALKLTVVVCKQCHLIGDFKPAGNAAAMAPNLERIHKRLRPDYLRQWLAKPTSILPYTNMPANFERYELNNQGLYHGTSQEQLDAVVDLLLNYDQVMKERTTVNKLVEEWAPPAAATDPAVTNPAAATNPATGAAQPATPDPQPPGETPEPDNDQ
jgi:cbb3-type cytochrome oxidase cytochrome c subunit